MWSVRVAIPRSAWKSLGKREKVRALGTSSLAEANRLKHRVIADLHDEIVSLIGEAPLLRNSPEWFFEQVRHLRKQRQDGGIDDEQLFDQIGALIEEHGKSYPSGPDGHPEFPHEDRIISALRTLDAPNHSTLQEAAEQYLKECEGTIIRSTLNRKENRLHALIDAVGADTLPDAITRRRMGQFVADIILPQGLAPQTMKAYTSDLYVFFKWAKGRGMVRENPCAELSDTLPKMRRGSGKVKRRKWTEAELLKALKISAGLNRDLMVIGLFTGMRINEICEMRVKNIHTTHVHLPEGKTDNSIRNVPIHDLLRPTLNRLKAASSGGLLFGHLKPAGEDKKRGHYASKNFGRWLRGKAEIADKAVVFHSLRYNFTHAMENAGVPLTTTKQITGHARPDITYGLYSEGVTPEELQKAVAKVTHGEEVDKLIRGFA